jgi:hypothetical protein
MRQGQESLLTKARSHPKLNESVGAPTLRRIVHEACAAVLISAFQGGGRQLADVGLLSLSGVPLGTRVEVQLPTLNLSVL